MAITYRPRITQTPPADPAVAQMAAAEPMRSALLEFSRERGWINAQHLELARVAAPTFFEQKRAAWFEERFRSLGCEAKVDRAGNVICFPHGDPGGGLVAVTAHLDTVLAPRGPDDIRVGPEGKFYGPGVADNGAGLAGLIAIARVLRERRLPGTERIVMVANVGEEGEGNLSGMRYLCRQSPLAARLRTVVVLDGPGVEQVTTTALGSRRFEIVFEGPGGHSWSDFGTGNPVHALSRVVADFADQFTVGEPRATFNFGIIEGGASINSIPSEARAKLDLRSESTERLNELAELLTDCVERSLEAENLRAGAGAGAARWLKAAKPSATRVTARIREIGSRPGGRLDTGAEIRRHLQQVDRYLGIDSREDCASTDANIPLSMGVPAVALGAGGVGGGAHTPAEWFHPEGREQALRRILLLLAHLV